MSHGLVKAVVPPFHHQNTNLHSHVYVLCCGFKSCLRQGIRWFRHDHRARRTGVPRAASSSLHTPVCSLHPLQAFRVVFLGRVLRQGGIRRVVIRVILLFVRGSAFCFFGFRFFGFLPCDLPRAKKKRPGSEKSLVTASLSCMTKCGEHPQ